MIHVKINGRKDTSVIFCNHTVLSFTSSADNIDDNECGYNSSVRTRHLKMPNISMSRYKNNNCLLTNKTSINL